VIRLDRPVFTQILRTESGVGWRRLLRVAALLLVLSHQAGAGIVCLCREECVTRLTTGQAAPHSTAPTDLCHAKRDESESVAEIGAASVEDQSVRPAGLGSCGWMQAPHEHVATPAADPIQVSAFTPSASSFDDAGINLIRKPDWDRNLRRSRPLYLTQSCYLI
jgi:hypothetical protein